jgi:pimeloyl-ACP methyl ester carboxylesterase
VGDANDKVLDALAVSIVAAGKGQSDLRNSAIVGGSLTASLSRGTLKTAATVLTTLTKAQIDGATTASGLMGLSGAAVCDVKVVKLNYNTIGVVGESTNASGVMLVPSGSGAGCTAPAGLIAYAKGTDVQKPHTLANPADGETFLLAAMYAAKGYAVVATDYLGFADSTYTYHPYLHADTEASSVIDSIRAARNAAAAVGASLNGKVMLTGYSQGGHSSMSTHRAIERDNASEINVVGGAHLAGPYNLSGSLKVTQAVAGAQFFIPYIVTAWQKVYGNIYSSPAVAFKAPYASYIETLLPNATLNYTSLVYDTSTTPPTMWLPGALGETPNQARDAIFQSAFIADVQTNNSSPLYIAAKKNDLLGWTPKSKVLLCGGAGDPTVPPVVHQSVLKADFDSRGLTNVTSVDVDPYIQATYGVAGQAPTDPTTQAFATYYGSYHGSYEPPFCAAQAKAFFDTVK